MKKCMICKIVTLIAGLGALNWLLLALMDMNGVTLLLGEGTTATKVVYIVIGLAGAGLIASLFVNCPKCPRTPPGG